MISMPLRAAALVALVFVALHAWSQETGAGRPVVRIGRVEFAPGRERLESLNPLAKYLESKIPGYSFQAIELPSTEALVDAFKNGRLEFAAVSPLIFPALENRYGARAIATAKYGYLPHGESAFFASAVICRKDAQDIHRLSDLRGKRVIVFIQQTMGWAAAWREFADLGIDPKRDFAALSFAGTLPEPACADVLDAVRQGRADAGVLPSDALSRLTAGQDPWFRVLPPPRADPESRDLPFAVSTRLYPAAPFVKAPHTSITLATAVTLALLSMPRDSEAANSGNSPGYTLPMSYAPLHECLRQLRLDPYTDYGKVTVAGAIQQHWGAAILLMASIALGFAATAWRVAHLNRRLHRSLERLDYQRQLIAQTSEAILAAGPDGRVTFLNNAAERLLGWEREKALGRQAEQVMRWSGGGDAVLQTLAQLAGDTHWSGERLIEGASGEPLRVEVSVSAMRSTAGEAAGIVACMRDVTALRSIEEQYHQSQKLETVGRLAAGVAHDFNNLLTIIVGYSEFLLKRLNPSDASRDYVLEVRKAGQRAASLTKQLLALSRKQVIEPRVLDLNATVREAAPMLQRLIGEDIAFGTRLDSSLGHVMADPDQLHQVIMNLAVNARDAMPDGGRLDIQTTNVELGPEDGPAPHPGIPAGRYVAMTVTDTGHGIDKTIRKKIFEPFFTTKEVGKGTGLGLSTVYGIVQQNGGSIDVWSEVGAGTRFTIFLPRVDAGVQQERNAIGAPKGGGGETILLVEDQEAVRTFTGAALRRSGYRVLEASNGDRAIAVAQRFPGQIHLLLTDVVMPGMNGRELSERLRELRPNLKVLFVSGYTADVIAHRGVLDRSVALLYKPFGPDELEAKVRGSLDDTSQ